MKHHILTLLALLCSVCLGARTRKAVYIIIDGVPADQIERLHTPAIFDIASRGAYGRAYTGGETGGYSQTPTISAIGYTNLLTATWANKHNVWGNSSLEPNYNYWTIFRIAREQPREVRTGLYSSWTDNRTVLIGEGKPETDYLKIDYVCDGYDLDQVRFRHREKDLHVFDYDEQVSRDAAGSILRYAPDLSWVYLWYTDDAGHFNGNGQEFDDYVRRADRQVARIWEAVQYREKHFDEEWMVVVTTDHGRTEDGHSHGGQSLRERTIWISTNVPVNKHFHDTNLSITDIAPSICRYLDFTVPRDVLWEQDGMPFIGRADICDLTTMPYDSHVRLSWRTYARRVPVTVYVATTNDFSTGSKDEYIKVADVPAGQTGYTVDLDKLPASKFYKFVVAAPGNHLNRWLKRR